ncbi:MAG TPA: autotransporter domain-containing protein, partial [Caulobacterales bacterium]|nr:autotransporter domain-containing protein [Caulobacterales bacterium]
MRGALKPFAFLAALIPVVAPKGALAETLISTATTAPVQTSTANDDLRIDSGGSIKPTASGPAVTLNSDDSVTNQGAIAFNNVDNATGILVDASAAARAGDVTNSGTINLIEDYTSSDSDGDGDPDGAYAQGGGRFGVRVSGANMFTGDIVQDSAGSIAIEGNNSAGVEIDGPMTGDLKIGGGLSILGDNSYGIRTTGNIVGDFRF